MIISEYKGFSIEALACCVPDNIKYTSEFIGQFGKNTVSRFSDMTGVTQRYVSKKQQTSSDLAYIAAETIITDRSIDRSKVGCIIFVTETPDYEIPSSAFIIQKRLGLSIDCLCFDVNLGCSGFTSGFNTLLAIMNSSNIEYGLLLFGDTLTKKVSPLDHSICMMLGDAGGAMLLRRTNSESIVRTTGQSLGNMYDKVCILGGRSRHPEIANERKEDEDGNVRGYYDLYMDGANVYFFSTSNVSNGVKEYLKTYELDDKNYDKLFLHQANKLIIEKFANRIGFPLEKTPLAITRYGNTGVASIPVALVTSYGDSKDENEEHLLMCGFGVGLSWALVDVSLKPSCVYPMIYSNDYYDDGMDEVK